MARTPHLKFAVASVPITKIIIDFDRIEEPLSRSRLTCVFPPPHRHHPPGGIADVSQARQRRDATEIGGTTDKKARPISV